MALSCTLFLEGALKKYRKYTDNVDDDMMALIKEWNIVLLSILKNNKYNSELGIAGSKLLKNIYKDTRFVEKCVSDAPDASLQALHYALRFQQCTSFLNDKIKNNRILTFCDLGCGLTPLAAVFQTKYNLSDIYCIDVSSYVADLYVLASHILSGKIPEFINWEEAKQKTCQKDLNTVVSVGCLPHMKLDVQKEYLRDINAKFDNFFVEIKYKKQEDVSGADRGFSIQELQKMRLEIENVDGIETAMIRNSISYLFKFVHSKPNYRNFLLNRSRSLFLSR